MAYDKRNNSRNRQRQSRQRKSASTTNPFAGNELLQTPFNSNWNTVYDNLNEYAYNPTANIVNDGSQYARVTDNGIQTKPSVFDTIQSPDEIIDKVNSSIHEENQSYYDNIFSEENLTEYQNDYDYRYNTTDEGFLKEYDEAIQQRVNNNADDIAHNRRVNEELKKSSKKYVSKSKQGQVIGEEVNYHQDISKKMIEEENLRKEQRSKDLDIKEHERSVRREQRKDAIYKKQTYEELFNEADHAEALAMNKKYDTYNNLFNEADHAEAIRMNNNYDAHVEALEMNKQFDYMASKTVDYDIDETIRKAIRNAKEDNLKGAQSALNQMARDENISNDMLKKAKSTLTERYDDVYRDIQSQRENLKKTVNKKISNGKDSYRIITDDTKTIGVSQNKGIKEAAEKAFKEEMEEEAAKNLKKSTMKNFGHVMNAGFAIMDYKDAREAGHSVGGSVARAGVEFAKGELLGGWYMAAMLAKSVPTIAVSAVEGLNTMSRSMNSMQRRQVFGDAEFMDTQQLATMRQSGMELAKMSQYNLQQTLMGNEAEHLHRL